MTSRFLSAYKTMAIIAVNTVLFAVAVDVTWSLVHRWRHPTDAELPGLASTLVHQYGDALKGGYPGRTSEEVRALVLETWSRPLQYEAFTGFRERPFRGQYVNVTVQGFRRNRDEPWPPPPGSVFVFGGSTTFGYGVADDETIPAYLDRWNRTRSGVRVYNFGRASYYSTQERILFERLLAEGHRPSVAVFIDGYNDFFYPDNEPAFTDDISNRFEAPRPILPDYFSDFAVVAGVRAIIRRFRPPRPPRTLSPADHDKTLNHYFANSRLIRSVADAYGVRAVFVWQPVPGYGRPLSEHPFFRGERDFGPALEGYVNAHDRRHEFDEAHIRWCADVLATSPRSMWVDWAHYSASFSSTLAGDCIAPTLAVER